MFFRETIETEEDIKRMFYEAREKMKNKITLKKKSGPGKFAVPCTVKGIEFPHALCDTGASIIILPRVMADQLGLKVEPSKESFTFVDCSQRSSGGIVRDLEVQIGNTLVPVDFHVLDIKLNWNFSLLLGRAFLSTTEYSASIETHTATSVDSANQKSIDIHKEESIDRNPGDWENDYYNPIMAVHNATQALGKGTRFSRISEADKRTAIDREIQESIDKANHPSIDINTPSSIDIRPQPPSAGSRWLCKSNGWTCTENIQRRVTNEFYDTAGGVDNLFKHKFRHHTRPSIDAPSSIDRRPEFGKRASYDRDGTRRFHWEEKDEYGVYRDDQGHARDIDGHIIRVSKDDIRSLLERASRDEHSYLCLPEHARSFTQTKLVPEIYTKDEINEMF
ncbi:hypothetical protein DY000_02030531 [Brassica cretica]|uniref:Aspartic peptidase DDI1-type domain-containing protein n=1 Tax=Brassica cretica TaxID=69181 RepID=A0ABQ7DWN5_BRACR|nr:hypothetical protein DY000_02030531 [Brassica cretica]